MNSGSAPSRACRLPRRVSENHARGRELAQTLAKVFQTGNDEVDNRLADLQPSVGNPGRAAPGDRVELLPGILVNHQIGGPRFIFKGHEGDPLGSGRTLSQQDQPGHSNQLSIAQLRKCFDRNDAQLLQLGTVEGNRMALQGKPRSPIVGKDLFHRIEFRQLIHGIFVRGKMMQQG